jgi:hypothetical protein
MTGAGKGGDVLFSLLPYSRAFGQQPSTGLFRKTMDGDKADVFSGPY